MPEDRCANNPLRIGGGKHMTRATRARITLKIRAGAKRTGFAGKVGDVWKLQVAAPPVDGKANDALTKFLAKLTGRPLNAVRVVSGFTSPVKTIEIDGIDSQSLDRAILESHGSETHTGIA
jgi:uncharacterized protein (TIGR00251 family)